MAARATSRRGEVVTLMEAQDKSAPQLSDEQAAEVRRRLAEQDPKTLTLAEFNERLRRRYGV
jgi:NADPH-dependent 2,4-dienoyl-CoA reductase/sulfur reductase-like enzyme